MLSRLRPRHNRPHSLRQPFDLFSRWLCRDKHQSSLLGSTNEQEITIAKNITQGRASEDDVFSYKAHRWLWNEPEQLRRRYLRFDLKALAHAAEDAAGPGANCIEVTKLPEGNFNKTFLMTMDDGRKLIARLPNPNAGRLHYTTASEVATMDYIRDPLQIPVPKVLAYSTHADTNGVGAEYIIMEKCSGVELGRLWDGMSGTQRIDIVRQLATFSARLSKARFPHYGSLYYARDILEIRGTEVDETFSVGPTTSRAWFDDRRGDIDVDRGPWASAEDVLNATMKREIACLEAFSEFPRDRQQGIFNGPGGFHASKVSKMAVIQHYSRILPLIMPKNDAYTASILWHDDLHSDNIFVNEDCPTEITGIIDWQNVHLSPAFLHVSYPSLIKYDGPILDGFEQPTLPSNFAALDPVAKEKAQSLHKAQSMWGLYQIFVQKEAPDLLRTLRYRNTLPCQIMSRIGSVFGDGEAYVQSMLTRLAEPEVWEKVVKINGQDPTRVPCPLVYSDYELSKQRDDLAKWEKDVERKARVMKEVGTYTGWDGAVLPKEYDMMSEKMEKARKRFLHVESRTSDERELWTNAWPFKDR
ncbi:kinase-like protein [Dothidotthia symphoricarpi CBS 119687]|uniref:Altered inheritance of mitochondria protein 9, mitochondrial n=1 Tax=Dothidotthia symphoricarpi CBS 119687 TaxID=1392245 RepID=A0A6A6AG51_9PLEO|nr:kinase-like protein [Dothidotthia symphoricarpi CBS 119687]KAF2130889.1 kinase-like protein [Dothidotthia symphoricarpi CBS 119687]